MARNIFLSFFLHFKVQRFVKPLTVPVVCLLGEAKTVVVAFSELILGKFSTKITLCLDFSNLERSKTGEKTGGFISALLCLSLSRLQVDTVVPIHAAPAGYHRDFFRNAHMHAHTPTHTHRKLCLKQCVLGNESFKTPEQDFSQAFAFYICLFVVFKFFSPHI